MRQLLGLQKKRYEIFLDWFSNKRVEYHQFSDELFSADLQYMNEYVNEIAKETFSSFDTGEKPSEFKQPENFYHGFTLGLIEDLRGIYHMNTVKGFEYEDNR